MVNENKALEVSLGLIDTIISHEKGLSVRELANLMNLPKSTVHRYLKSLLHYKLIEINSKGKYGVGLELYRIASKALTSVEIRNIAFPHLEELVEVLNETVYLCVYEDTRIVFIDKVECTHNLRHFVEIGKVMTLHPLGATGKAILAFLPEAEVKNVLEKAQGIFDLKIDVDIYKKELEIIREKGFASSYGVRVPGVYGIASPIFNARRVIGALDVTIPESRLVDDLLVKIGFSVKECALKISLKMGFREATSLSRKV